VRMLGRPHRFEATLLERLAQLAGRHGVVGKEHRCAKMHGFLSSGFVCSADHISNPSPVIGGGGPQGRRGKASDEIHKSPTSEFHEARLRHSPSAPYDGAPPAITPDCGGDLQRARRAPRC
jgi:hypothetical protein